MLVCHVIPGINVLVMTICTVLPPRHEAATHPAAQHVQTNMTHYSSQESSHPSHFEQRGPLQSANPVSVNTQPSLLEMQRE
ncbi:hypothetical protein GDO81_000568 [Engystomops pustulosus]|uniref:Secreted protein n=1 Tax=Engystomops pustulosus TaxID=76066 RepID=A0AAV7D9C4_ENGPU|nr:hypothetical protein GDO81_000568 [Engystomops pustulosus]